MPPASGPPHSPRVGLGLRRCHLETMATADDVAIDYLEVAPENWMKVGGRLGRQFRALTERFPFYAHGLSLSLGGSDPLDLAFITALRHFLDSHGMLGYSEHLSYSSQSGHLYDLMPLPFTEDAIRQVCLRIEQVEDLLGRRIAIENVSYYAAPWAEMSESEFVCEILRRADCDLLLDVNNVFVNSINHGYDPREFLGQLPSERIVGLHVAGHFVERDDLLIDTHGAPVVERVWDLLADTYRLFGVKDTLLERDFNIPPLSELLAEVRQIRALQAASGGNPQ